MSDHTVVSGSATNAQHGIECASCGSANPFGMRFCLSCGRPALYSQMTEKKVGPCTLCGCADALNQAFCIACGTALVGEDSPTGGKKKRTGTGTIISSVANAADDDKQQAITVKYKTGFSWEPPAESRSAQSSNQAALPLKRSVPKKRDSSRLMSSIIGCLFGAVLAAGLSKTEPAKYVFERLHWPSSGLVVYASPANAKVVLENVATNCVTVAQTEADGSLKLKDAQPGQYRLYLKAPGSDDSTFTNLTIEANRPTVVGFPTPIKLASSSR